jgi:hypothetical protein
MAASRIVGGNAGNGFQSIIFGQDGFEYSLSGLVSTDPALRGRLYGAGFLRHGNLLLAENVKHHRRLSKQVHQDRLRTLPILNISELGLASSAGLARELAKVVAEPIFDIPRLVEAAPSAL